MKVIDFSRVRTGTVVRRSRHWLKARNVRVGHPDRTQIGIIVGHDVLSDPKCGVVSWPITHWEGGVMANCVHPVNVALHRKADRENCRFVEMAG